jgi:hypothetical protein
MRTLSVVMCAAVVCLAACGDSTDKQSPTSPVTASEPESSAIQLDFDNLNICELIPGATVATALGGQLADPAPIATTATGLGTQCLYTEALEGSKIDARISLSPPDYWMMDPDQRELNGLGDEAYATTTDLGVNGTAHDIYVLVRGQAEVNTTANTSERAEILARLALDQLRSM